MHEAVDWLDDDEMRAWRTLVVTSGRLMTVLDTDLVANCGVPMAEYEVLVLLSEEDEHRLQMSDLADRLLLSPSGLTRRLDRLVRAGLVERERCPSDRRVFFAVLTPTGAEHLERAAPGHVRSVREHFIQRLSRQDLETLADILDKLGFDH